MIDMQRFCCLVCGSKFAFGLGAIFQPTLMIGTICPECGFLLCPTCRSHNVADITVCEVRIPPEHAASVRASVWGRGS